jgi:hypothetical protein
LALTKPRECEKGEIKTDGLVTGKEKLEIYPLAMVEEDKGRYGRGLKWYYFITLYFKILVMI